MDYFYVFQEYGMKQKILCHVFKDTVLQLETGYQTALNMKLNSIAL